MGDCKKDHLNAKERQYLDTITILYGLHTTNTELQISVQDNSLSLIGYIILELSEIDNFQTVVSGTLRLVLHGVEIDHYVKSLISTIKRQQRSKALNKKFPLKIKYIVQMFQQLINDSDWATFYKQDFDEAMFTILSTVLEHALKKRATRETVFIRNDKSDIIFHQKWMTEETRNFYQQTKSKRYKMSKAPE